MSLKPDPRLREVAKQRCRELRKKQTRAEQIFWNAVRNRRFYTLKFYRQYPIFFDYEGKETFYVADFYCHEKKLVVEIDGKIHDFRPRQDSYRSAILKMQGIRVIRFTNEQVESQLDIVLKQLKEELGI